MRRGAPFPCRPDEDIDRMTDVRINEYGNRAIVHEINASTPQRESILPEIACRKRKAKLFLEPLIHGLSITGMDLSQVPRS